MPAVISPIGIGESTIIVHTISNLLGCCSCGGWCVKNVIMRMCVRFKIGSVFALYAQLFNFVDGVCVCMCECVFEKSVCGDIYLHSEKSCLYCWRCPRRTLRSCRAAHGPADGPRSGCMARGAAMDGPHTGRSTTTDHGTCTGGSFHVAASTTWPSIPMASILDCVDTDKVPLDRRSPPIILVKFFSFFVRFSCFVSIFFVIHRTRLSPGPPNPVDTRILH